MDEALTTYQRGNRDGLLSVAARYRMRAALHDQEAERMARSAERPGLPAHAIRAALRLSEQAAMRAAVWQDAARTAELAAAALPSDPGHDSGHNPSKAAP